jgi:UDP-galactopyranose mutase
VYEYPQAEGDAYYPIPRSENAEIYHLYHALADQTEGVHFVGRLATYKYYNMDQVVAQAITVYARLAGVNRPEAATRKADPKVTTVSFPNGRKTKRGEPHRVPEASVLGVS